MNGCGCIPNKFVSNRTKYAHFKCQLTVEVQMINSRFIRCVTGRLFWTQNRISVYTILPRRHHFHDTEKLLVSFDLYNRFHVAELNIKFIYTQSKIQQNCSYHVNIINYRSVEFSLKISKIQSYSWLDSRLFSITSRSSSFTSTIVVDDCIIVLLTALVL